MEIRMNGKPDQAFQELIERCLSVLWNEYLEYGVWPDEMLEVAEDMGLSEDELTEMFHQMGYEEYEGYEEEE